MRSNRKILMAAVAATGLIGSFAKANTVAWDGGDGSSTSWSVGQNWVGDVAPVTNDSAVFDNSAVATAPNNTVDTSITLAKLTYQQDNSSVNPDGAYNNAYVTTINPAVTLTLSADPAGNNPAPANANLLVMPATKALSGNTSTIVKIIGGAGSKLVIQDPDTSTGHAMNVGGMPLSSASGDAIGPFESSAILDLSQLDEFDFMNNGAQNFTRSNFGIATGTSTSNDRGAVSGTVILGNTATISGNRLVVGGQHGTSSDHNSPVALLLAGQTTNINTTLNGGNLYVGRDPNIAARACSGAVTFRAGLTDPALNLGGPGSSNGFEVGNARGSSQGGAYHMYGNVDGTRASGTSEGTVNGNLASLRIGEGYASGSNTGGAYGQFSFSRGIIAANNGSMGRTGGGVTGASTTTMGIMNVGLKPTGDASEQGGGAINFSANLTVGLRNASSSGINMGIVTLDNAGQISVPQLLLGENSAADNGNGAVHSIINLNGGVLTTQQIKAGAAAGSDVGTHSTRLVNFDGGTVKVASNTFASSFLQGITAATVFSGGGTMDTNGSDVTVAQALVAPTQNGLTSITVTDGGSKYRSAPIVAITNDPSETAAGDGSAIATIDSNGHVNGIIITNPGSYTVLPQIHLIANGGDTADGAELPYGGTKATFMAALTASPLSSGGFTKIGAGKLTLTGNNTYSGATTVEAGTLQLSPAAQTPVLTGPGGAVIDGGNLVLDYTGGNSPAIVIRTELKNGYASNFTTGRFRSTAATSSLGLGWTDDTSNSKATIGLTYFGDSNVDGVVDANDFTNLANGFGKLGQDWQNGDFNYDGVVNAIDFNILASNFGSNINPGPGVSLGSVVPEPATLGLLAVGALGVLRRRRGC